MKEAEKENKVTASAPRFDNGGRQSTTHTNCGHPALHQQERRRRADAPRRPSTRHKRAAAARRAGICLRGGGRPSKARRDNRSLRPCVGGAALQRGGYGRGGASRHTCWASGQPERAYGHALAHLRKGRPWKHGASVYFKSCGSMQLNNHVYNFAENKVDVSFVLDPRPSLGRRRPIAAAVRHPHPPAC